MSESPDTEREVVEPDAEEVLNRLVAKGELRKMQHKQTIYYVSPREAVRQWKRRHGCEEEIPVEKIIDELAEETGLPVGQAQRLLTLVNITPERVNFVSLLL
jgi:hypothetical protein